MASFAAVGAVALVEYFTTAARTLIFAVTSDREAPVVAEARVAPDGRPLTEDELLRCAERLLVDFHGLPVDWDRTPRAERLREILALPPAVNAAKRTQPVLQRNLRKPAFAYEQTYWERLADALLPAEIRAVVAGCELLCFVPHGPLHSLPLTSLRWTDGAFLVERFGVCTAPSASVLRSCRARSRSRTGATGPESCLIAAVAAADDAEPDELEADGETLADIARGAGATVATMAGAEPRNGLRPASKTLVAAELPRHDLVHFACHGVFDAEEAERTPLDAAGLLLSDGTSVPPLHDFGALPPQVRVRHFLTAREVLALDLQAELVTLRACSSGRAEVRSGDELLGLTRAFLHAGTPSLIVSLWNVNKRSSRRLLDDFYRTWLGAKGELPKWRALQEAQCRMLADAEFSHPYHWAPFVLVGDWN